MSDSATGTRRGLKALDFRDWSDRERHFGSVVVIVAVSVILVAGIALQFLAPGLADTLLWVLFALVVIALAYQAGAVYYGMRTSPSAAAAEAEAEDAAPDEHAAWAPADDAEPAAGDVRILTLRCGHCSTEFDLRDDGTRPLYHSCPSCGNEGVLRGEAAAPASAPAAEAEAPVTEESPWARPEGSPAPEPEDAPEPEPEPEPETPAVKNVKLRCPGCKHVFPVEDTGARPLRTRCPSCGRLGEIRG